VILYNQTNVRIQLHWQKLHVTELTVASKVHCDAWHVEHLHLNDSFLSQLHLTAADLQHHINGKSTITLNASQFSMNTIKQINTISIEQLAALSNSARISKDK